MYIHNFSRYAELKEFKTNKKFRNLAAIDEILYYRPSPKTDEHPASIFYVVCAPLMYIMWVIYMDFIYMY